MEAGVLHQTVSDVISIREFLQSWDASVIHDSRREAKDSADIETFAELMELDKETVKELDQVCSLDHLKNTQEPVDRWRILGEIPEDLNLMCVRFQKREMEKRKDPAYNMIVQKKIRQKMSTRMNMPTLNQTRRKIPPQFQVTYPEVILTVHIHKPMLTMKDKRPTLTNEHSFLVLGHEKLTELRDYIRCTNDLAIPGDQSDFPDCVMHNYAKDIFKSGFFYIEGTFYNDTRESDCRDYSQNIIKWAKEKNLGQMESHLMEECTFLDLKIRLGQPYVYVHQGDCEHIIIFSDIRLLSSEDPQDTREYPFLTFRIRSRRNVCKVCMTRTAKWVVYDSEYAPENPCFFCDQCFRPLHYDINGIKKGEFKAYKYFDNQAIV
ncbi:hypothetical protein ACJMK2_043669 [Sinanodonta woodiana]|uniref:snRNA-activating protein complex subunit 3 n=1 Tax=Sinanodonta woodiana TaxID=1069815 RepID=A0ABD3VXN3_SINWO